MDTSRQAQAKCYANIMALPTRNAFTILTVSYVSQRSVIVSLVSIPGEIRCGIATVYSKNRKLNAFYFCNENFFLCM